MIVLDDRLKGSGVLCPWRGHGLRQTHLRRRASRPQLKRDPLGSAMAQHYRAIQLLQDPGLPGKVTIGGRERPWVSKVPRVALQPLARWRLYRWRRLVPPQLDRLAGQLAAELSRGVPPPGF